jgi:transposase
VDAISPIRKPRRSRPRKRPMKLRADKAYDFARCREALRKRGIKARIARRGIDSSERLGRHRWVVERTLTWLARYRRLAVRYERRDDIHEALSTPIPRFLASGVLPAGSIATTYAIASREDGTVCGLALFGNFT